jgi:hypothetical protein
MRRDFPPIAIQRITVHFRLICVGKAGNVILLALEE